MYRKKKSTILSFVRRVRVFSSAVVSYNTNDAQVCAIRRRRPLDDHRRTHLQHKPATSLYHRRQSHNDVGMKMSIIILCAATAAATHTNTTHTRSSSSPPPPPSPYPERYYNIRNISLPPPPLVMAATVAWPFFYNASLPTNRQGDGLLSTSSCFFSFHTCAVVAIVRCLTVYHGEGPCKHRKLFFSLNNCLEP